MIQPTTQYPQPGGANAVSINIFNPQAYGSGATAMPQQPMVNNNPYTNSLYNMPQASMYQQPMIQPNAFQQYMPMMPQQPMMQPNNEIINEAPVQPMPQSVMPQQVEQNNNVSQPVAQEVQEQPVAQQPIQQADVQKTPEQAPEIVESAPAQTVDVDSMVQNLKSTDANVKSETINQIAACAQEQNPEIALQVVSEPIMQGLVDIIKEDTSKLEGPTKEQIAVADKISKGEQLTPEEDKLSEQLSPRDMANKNRIFALYTLAMVQKLQRDELNQYIETQKANGQEAIPALKVEDLVGYNDVVNTIQNDPRPEVKVAAIQSLQHVAEPQDKATVETVLADSLKSKDEGIKKAATEAMTQINAMQQAA